MAEYIDRQAAIDSLLGWAAQLTETYGKNDEYVRCLESAAYNIEQIPAADVRPVVRGKWSIVYDDFMKSNYTTCSCCGKEYFGANGFNFCPNCGADMREES